MPLAYIVPRTGAAAGQPVLCEIIALEPGSPPERPHPQPPLGIWGPDDPRPTHPIAGIPGLPGAPGDQPRPEHPIFYPPGTGPTPPPGGSGNHPAHPIVLPPDKPVDPAQNHVLVGVTVPGSGQGLVWFYIEVPPPPTEPAPKPA